MKKSNNKGFSLIEMLVVLVLSVIAIVALLYSLISTFPLTELAREQTIAVSHLRNMMEEIRSTSFDHILGPSAGFPNGLFPQGVIDGPPDPNNPGFTLYQTIVGGYALAGEQITINYANPNADPLEINVALAWQDRRGRNFNASVSTFKTR